MTRRFLPALLLALAALGAETPVGTRVTGAFACEALGRPPIDVAVNVYRLPGNERVRQTSWASGRFSIFLPPGEYRFHFHGVEMAARTLAVTIGGDQAELDLGTVDLEPSLLASCYGKPPPPWRVSEARGVDPKATLADFKGKWVVLEFWGYW